MSRSYPTTNSWKQSAARPSGKAINAGEPNAFVPRRRWSFVRLLLGFLFFTVLFGFLVYLILWLQPIRGTAVVLIGTDYAENLAIPHNVHGVNGLRAVADLTHEKQSEFGRLRLESKNYQIIDIKDWDKGLRHGPEKNLLVYLSMHGGADEKGGFLYPQLTMLPEEAGSLIPDRSRLRLETILDRLEKIPSNRRVVLILDATQLSNAWHVGMIYNNFARELEQLNQRIENIPNLVILSASAPDQKSWTSNVTRQSVFGYFVSRGLSGDADSNQDSRVTALELHDFVSKRVEGWVATNREAVQTPVLLPLGKTGRDRADEIRLAVVEKKNSLPTLSSELPEKDLLTFWEKYDDLSQAVPNPTVYTPALWSAYSDTLARFEELTILGEKETSQNLANKLKKFIDLMETSKELKLTSFENTLTMPALASLQPLDRTVVTNAFDQLRNAKPQDWPKIWEKLKNENSDPPYHTQLLRLGLSYEIIQLISSNPSLGLDNGTSLLRLLDDPTSPRPAEAQYVLMTARDIVAKMEDAKAMPATLSSVLGEALRIRLKAEQAVLGLQANRGTDPSPYCERVAGWILEYIRKGDQQRRLGQDLLFAADEKSWEKARDYLHKAENAYQQAIMEGNTVLLALLTRDELVPKLRDYARWMALSMESATSVEARKKIQEHVDDFAKTCQECHALIEKLEVDPPLLVIGDKESETPKEHAIALSELNKQTKIVQDSIARLHALLEDAKKDEAVVISSAAWHRRNNLLALPDLGANNRMLLLKQRMLIDEKLFAGTIATQDTTSLNRDTRDISKLMAQTQAKLAIAILGEHWFDNCGGDANDSLKQITERLAVANVQESWWNAFVAVGREIGIRWQQFPVVIDSSLQINQRTNSTKVRDNLQLVDRLTRFMDGAGLEFLAKTSRFDYRQLLVQELLLWQAERTYGNHWYSEDPNASKPYYQVAAEAFLFDATSNLRDAYTLQPTFDNATKLVQTPGRMQLALFTAPGIPAGSVPTGTTPLLHLTTELQFPVQFQMGPDAENAPPDGYPVVWMETGDGISGLKPQQLQKTAYYRTAANRITFGTKIYSPELAKLWENPPKAPKVIKTKFTAKGLFRGQRIQLPAKVELHPLAQQIKVEHPAPLMSSIAVRAPKAIHDQFGASSGHIAIVLDASGSMGPRKDQPEGEPTKFQEATQALQQVLGTLSRGATVSVWMFGEATGREKTQLDAEKTIRNVFPAQRWDPDSNQMDTLMNALAKVEPWNETPLLRTMLRAAQTDLDCPGGLKSMIVITDGIDNRIANDAEYNPEKKDIPTLLEENFRSIQIDFIGFKISDAEEAKAREQFQVIEQLPIPGHFYSVKDSAKLIAALRNALPQKLRYWVDRADNRPLFGKQNSGLDVSVDGENDQWIPGGLPPGNYQVRVYTDQRLTARFALSQSDLLLMELNRQTLTGGPPGPLQFRRIVYSRSDYPWKPWKSESNRQDWIMAALQNQLMPDQSAQMLLTLEKSPDPLATIIQQRRPKMLWMEVDAKDGNADSYSQKWYYQPGYPAPTWTVSIPKWPGRTLPGGGESTSGVPARPIAKMWWNPDQSPDFVSVLRDHDYALPEDVKNLSVRIGDEQIILESLKIETHEVETTAPGVNAPAVRKKLPCLVVRMSYGLNAPVWTRLRGLATGGSEHHYFSRANKYTGIFWPVTAEQAQKVLEGIEICSLAKFKEDAAQRNYYIAMDNLPPPQQGDSRPMPPVDLSSLVFRDLGSNSGDWQNVNSKKDDEQLITIPPLPDETLPMPRPSANSAQWNWRQEITPAPPTMPGVPKLKD